MTPSPGSVPLIASYRVQLTPTFGFAETIDIFDHLTALGVSHLYLSPITEAVPGSLHGYDVIDHTKVRSEFGGDDGLSALLDAAADHGVGVIIDHVPNHMSVERADLNDRWWEMLRDGPDSPAADWFDIDWAAGSDADDAGTDSGRGRVIVPKLGDPLDVVLADGGLTIGDGGRGPELRYGPLRFPLAAGTEGLDVADAVRRQHYRLAWWRDPARNVRRFFTIDDLVAVRAELPEIAAVINTIPARLSVHPAFAGVRVDHVDGLAQPEAYLEGLREQIGPDRWLLVEKILAVDETLPPSWPVDGTTGYEHIRVTEHAFLAPEAEPTLTELWTEVTGDDRTFADLEDEARREVLAGGLRPDLDRLVTMIDGAARQDAIDGAGAGTRPRLAEAVVELVIAVRRYRTYLPDDAASVVELDAAFTRAVTARPDLRTQLSDLVDVIRELPEVATRWEQLCSPVMAKGAEDRAFYRYLRLAALCEVGGAPGQWSLGSDEFHRYQSDVQESTPLTMLAGTTHDTKRSEGVRARALALADIASDWADAVRTWMRDHPDLVDGSGLDAATILLALETAVTAWPIDAERLTDYLVKSSREADVHTSWTEPDDRYESALARLAAVLERELGEEAVEHATHDMGTAGIGRRSGEDDTRRTGDTTLADIVATILRPGWATSTSALAIRLTAPGVPDLYQGTTAFTYSLVDPDNRVEPDWDERRALTRRAADLDGRGAWEGGDVEAAKAVVITRTLGLRRRRLAAFGAVAGYLPVAVTGEHADRVLAFARTDGDRPLVVTIVTTRPSTGMAWGDTAVELPSGTWQDILTDDAEAIPGGATVAVAAWLEHFPVAVLDRTNT